MLFEDGIPELVMSLVQHTNLHKDEQHGSSDDKYCVYECCIVTVAKLQNTLTEVVAIMRSKPTHIAMEEAHTLE